MRKLILFLVLVGLPILGMSQDAALYKMDVRLWIYHQHDNDVDACGSFFKITFQNSSRTTLFEWYSSLSIGDNSGKEYLNTFYFSKSDPVRYIKILSNRYYENGIGSCKHADGGNENTIDLLASTHYPCGSITRAGMFSGFDGSSQFSATISPLSNAWTIQSEVTSTTNFGGSLLMNAELEYTDGSREVVFASTYGDYPSGSVIRSRNLHLKTDKSKIVRRVHTTARKNFFTVVERSFDVSDTGIGNDLVITLDNPYQLAFGSNLIIRYVRPKTRVTASQTSLPSNNSINLSIDENLANAQIGTQFQWQYSIEGGPFNNLPAQFGNGANITISGETLFSALGLDWKNYVFKTIQFKAVHTCFAGRETATIALTHVPSAPGIISATAVPETCPGFNDGKVRIKFDRPLYQFTANGQPSSELLYIFLNGTLNEFQVTAFEEDNTVTIGNRQPGAYTPTLLTTFAGFPNGYSDGPNHTAPAVTVAARSSILFSATTSDVHCHGGGDGAITVTAQGGTESYTSYIVFENAVIDEINLSQNAANTFSNLKAGTYTVRLKDTNQCDPLDAQGQPKTESETVGEPSQSLFVSAIEAIEPRGYGLSDGHIRVRGEYGTTPYSIEWKNLQDNSTLTPDAPVAEGESITSNLANVGKGRYFVRFQDANFDLVTTKTDVNVRGCFDTLTIVMDQPPLLEVGLEEFHYVSCYGYDDGEIVAHAKGGRPNPFGQPYHPYRYEWYVLNGSDLELLSDSDSIAVNRTSAWYRVKVTDRNGIEAWSSDFQLVQPEQLKVGFNTSTLLCNGDTNATSEALVTGGTQPYGYAWSTDETTSSIEGLSEGWYSVIVTDQRECTTLAQTEVQVPDGLELTAEIVNPTCYQYADGRIQVSAEGGKSPYVYTWNHQSEPADLITGLREGSYTVKVEDDNHCFIEQTYLVEDPALLPVTVGSDKVLCKDQVLILNATIDDPNAQYLWFKDGATFASTPSVSLVDAGLYLLRVTDSDGCTNEDDIRISRDETQISADFVVATRVPRGERVRVANISNPAPENIEWLVPPGVTILEENSEYLELTFNDFGEYVLGMRSSQGQCEKTEYKTVQSLSSSELPDYRTPDEPYIKQFVVSPNPNDGNFTATVELRESADFKLVFHSVQGTVVAVKDIRSQSFSNVKFELSSSVSDGIYVLQLLTPKGISTFKIGIKK